LYLAFGEDGNAIGKLPQEVEIMGDHDDGQPEQVAQRQTDVLLHRQLPEEAAVVKHHTPALA